MTEFFNIIGNILLFSFLAGLGFLYFRNIYKIYLDIQNEKYSVLTVMRVIGVFFVVLGVALGLV